jgi:hypothetical protein
VLSMWRTRSAPVETADFGTEGEWESTSIGLL